jgi:hypothetical protein
LVNDMALLVPGSFVRSTTDDVVVSGKESYPVQGRGRRIMKGIFNGANGPSTVDLTLTNVAVVEGFHVNIVSEKLLRVKNMWYCGYDCTVRHWHGLCSRHRFTEAPRFRPGLTGQACDTPPRLPEP